MIVDNASQIAEKQGTIASLNTEIASIAAKIDTLKADLKENTGIFCACPTTALPALPIVCASGVEQVVLHSLADKRACRRQRVIALCQKRHTVIQPGCNDLRSLPGSVHLRFSAQSTVLVQLGIHGSRLFCVVLLAQALFVCGSLENLLQAAKAGAFFVLV